MPTLETVFDSDASFDSNTPFDDRLAAHPNLTFWARSDDDCVVADGTGRITRINSNPESATYALAPNGANCQYVARSAGRWPGVRGNGVNSVLDVISAQSWATPWTIAAIYKPAAFGADRMLVANFNSVPKRMLFGLKANGNFQVSQGDGSAEVAARAGEWNVSIGGFDGASVFNMTNGVEHQFPSNGLVDEASTVIGGINLIPSQVFNGDWADILFFDKCLFLEPDALDWINGMARVLYGVNIATGA